jgi:hypothetical protein
MLASVVTWITPWVTSPGRKAGAFLFALLRIRLALGFRLQRRVGLVGRVQQLLRQACRYRRAVSANNAQRRAALTKQLTEAESKIGRLYAAVENGTLTDTTLLRSRLHELEKQRDEAVRLLRMLDSELPALRQALSKAQAVQIASHLKGRLLNAPKPLQRRYVRGLVSEIVVDREQAVTL